MKKFNSNFTDVLKDNRYGLTYKNKSNIKIGPEKTIPFIFPTWVMQTT